jgi:hypothetical protein
MNSFATAWEVAAVNNARKRRRVNTGIGDQLSPVKYTLPEAFKKSNLARICLPATLFI